MTRVTFYEKPGCLSNVRQKALLTGLGHDLEVRNLLSECWAPECLRLFFGDRPVPEWFNPTAPRVKSGAVDPASLGAPEALALMVSDPILIRRPLIEAVGLRCSGFEAGPLLDALGVVLREGEDLQSCPHPARSGGGEPIRPEPERADATRAS